MSAVQLRRRIESDFVRIVADYVVVNASVLFSDILLGSSINHDVENLCPGVYYLEVEDMNTGSSFSSRAVKI